MRNLESISYLLQTGMPLTNRMGVYMGLNKKYGEVVYVGKSKDYWKRTPDSLEKKIKKLQRDYNIDQDYGCDLITFTPCETVKEMNELEIKQIEFWHPYYNDQHNKDHFLNFRNKRLREILRQELGRNLHTYEIKFSQFALSHYVLGNPHYELAKQDIINYSGIVKKGHEGFDLSRKKCKKINSLARQLSRIISIHYDYSKPYQERTEEEKERWRKNSDENSPYRQAQKEYFKAHANIQI